MRRVPAFFYTSALLALISPLFSGTVLAQSSPLPRITEAIDNANLAPLSNQVHPLIGKAVDQGPVDGAMPLDRLTLVLNRTDAQQQALTLLLADQQNPTSANYHRWLTPQEFGARFGAADSDIEQVTGWLQSQGFKVDHVANGRGFIEFSGTAQQVASAFHTSIHNYSLNGEQHIANATMLAIPAALAPVVGSVRSLNNFRSRPLHTSIASRVSGTMGDAQSRPEINFADGSHGLAPADYEAIYSIPSTNNSGGGGETIAVVGRSNINPATLTNFRTIFSLTGGSNTTILNGPDPGILDQIGVPCTTQTDCSERDEALLDNEWSSAIAPSAAVKFVVSQTTNTADGIDLSEAYIIDNNIADVMSESFGGCEAESTQTDANAISLLASQAAAQGITYVVATGDSGAAACANPETASATGVNATPSVNILASSPFTIAVGGTEFNEGCTIGSDGVTLNCSNYAAYWNTTNAASNSATPFRSAIGHIPENVWNEACPATTTGSVTGCGANANLFAGGGGASQFFPKPSWQQLAIPGIPAANHRYLPDVSLSAAGHDPYVVCLADSDCEPDATGNFTLHGIAGTSASTPAFAGIMALVDQRYGRQGDAHAVLYGLAVVPTTAKCDASSQSTAPDTSCFFNDVTVGNNAVPGETGYGTSSTSYQAEVGYDQATGLGSVNATNLVYKFAAGASVASKNLLTITPSTLTRGTTAVLTATVTGAGGTPTGTVSFNPSTGGSIGVVLLSSGVATLITPDLELGSYSITADYSGDLTFIPSNSSPVNVVVTSTTDIATTTVLTTSTPTITVGQDATFHVVVSHATGSASLTGTVGTREIFDPSVSRVFATLNPDGTADITIHNLALGTHSIDVLYAGDANYAPSDSTSVDVAVNVAAKINTTTTVTSSSKTLPATGVSSITLTASVIPASGSTAPTGTVTFFDGSTFIGTATATSTDGSTATATFTTNVLPSAQAPTPHTVAASRLGWIGGGGLATLACFVLMLPTRRRRWPMAVLLVLIGSTIFAISGCGSGGSQATASNSAAHQITAQYNGDSVYAPSTSSALTITVQ